MTATAIVALDVQDRTAARAIVAQLGEACDFYKVGLELFAAEGPDVVRWLRDEGKRVFVDLKLHDIPNTVRGAARSVASLGASLLTVHASGGPDMIAAAVRGVGESGTHHEHRCEVLGVTILTSLGAADVETAWDRRGIDVEREVSRLAGLVRAGGGAGIVCSGHEARAVKAAHGDALGLLIPGIRLAGGAAHDQQRVMTPEAAVRAGARWIVLGRAVTGARDPVEAMAVVSASLASVP